MRILLFWWSVIYLFFSFVAWSFNPPAWSPVCRAICSILFVFYFMAWAIRYEG